eukprot:4971945-Amphidinium_carterae.1
MSYSRASLMKVCLVANAGAQPQTITHNYADNSSNTNYTPESHQLSSEHTMDKQRYASQLPDLARACSPLVGIPEFSGPADRKYDYKDTAQSYIV